MPSLQDFTWPEALKQLKSCNAIIIPIGSLEQHGYHLPINTDNYLTDYFVSQLAKKFNCCSLPTLPFGQTWSSSGFPGTIALQEETAKQCLIDIIDSVLKDSPRRIILFSWHRGNVDIIKQVMRHYQHPSIYCLPLKDYSKILTDVLTTPIPSGIWHAGELETSLMMALYDKEIDLSLAEKTNVSTKNNQQEKWHHINAIGSWGDATVSSKQQGEIIYSRIFHDMSNEMEKIISEPFLQPMKHLVFDIDGTLLNSQGELTTNTIQALQECKNKGYILTLASGRDRKMMLPLLAKLQCIDYMITGNGATIVDCNSQETMFNVCLSSNKCQIIIDYLLEKNYHFTMYSNKDMFSSLGNKAAEKRVQKLKIDYEQFSIDETIEPIWLVQGDKYNTENISKIVLYGNDEQIKTFINDFKQHHDVSIESTGYGLLGIFNKKVSKRKALEVLNDMIHCQTDETMSFGDFDNDIPLFEASGVSVAMMQSPISVLTKATYITASNDEDGVSLFLKETII